MSLFQALLLALFGWMSSIYSPVLMGGLGGWYTLGRPLVSGSSGLWPGVLYLYAGT